MGPTAIAVATIAVANSHATVRSVAAATATATPCHIPRYHHCCCLVPLLSPSVAPPPPPNVVIGTARGATTATRAAATATPAQPRLGHRTASPRSSGHHRPGCHSVSLRPLRHIAQVVMLHSLGQRATPSRRPHRLTKASVPPPPGYRAASPKSSRHLAWPVMPPSQSAAPHARPVARAPRAPCRSSPTPALSLDPRARPVAHAPHTPCPLRSAHAHPAACASGAPYRLCHVA